MSQSSSSNPNASAATDPHRGEFLSVAEIHRWQQNVESFAETTQTMLESIQSELSSGFASGRTTVGLNHGATTITQDTPANGISFAIPNQPALPMETTMSNKAGAAKISSADNQTVDAITAVTTDQCDALLARLKQQLADQLAD